MISRFEIDIRAAQAMQDMAMAKRSRTNGVATHKNTEVARTIAEPVKPDFLITLPRLGLRVIAPRHVQAVMERAKRNKESGQRFSPEEKQSLWPITEKARLNIMANCAILRRRYPTRVAGEEFMQNVDYERREELLQAARHLTEGIVGAWKQIDPKEDIAVLLFGSVAKGLVKREDHPDPSNVDLAVIGNIRPDQRVLLLDAIRPERERIREEILARVPVLHSKERNPGNAGVMVQHTDKLRNGEYYGARNYIASGAFALYDPTNIWGQMEQEALAFTVAKATERTLGHATRPRFGIVFNPSATRG